MNIIANNVVAKLTVAFVAAAMLFTFATPTKAATVEELQAQIAALMAQISALSGGDAPAAPSTGCDFSRSLTIGSEGGDVTCLQDYLTPMYYNFAGGSTGYFGPVTQEAVAAWQSANGVMPAVGYFGPVSIAKYDSMMMPSTPSTPDTPSTDDSGDDMDDEDDFNGLSGEASLDNMEIDSAEEDEIEEGASDAVVAEVTLEFTDGDAEISRMDVQIDPQVVGVDPWDLLEEVALWVDGDKIASFDAQDEDDYLDEDTGEIRFSGLDIVAMEDEELEIAIAVEVMSNVDTPDIASPIDVSVESLRFFDADGVATTENSGQDFGTNVDFTIEVAGSDDELIVKTSSDDPSGTTLQLEDDKDSDWYNVFTFDLDSDDSENDIELNEVVVTVDVSSSTYNALVDDAEIVIDGTTIDDVTVAGGGTATAVLTFDVDGDVTIDAGDRIAAELMLQFNSLASGDEGTTVQAEVTSANADAIDAEGADDLSTSQLSGAADGDVHTLRTQGVDVAIESTDAEVTDVDGATNDYGTYTIEVEVTAFEQDVYISTNPATSTTYALEDGSSVAAVAGTRTVTLTSTGDETGGYFEITEGSTETLTLEVTYIPGAAGTAARLQLETIEFAASQSAPDQTWTASPEEDYRTDVKTIVN